MQVFAWAPLLAVLAVTSCGHRSQTSDSTGGAASSDTGQAGASGAKDDAGAGGVIETAGVSGTDGGPPAGYTQSVVGGYKLGPEVTAATSANSEEGGAGNSADPEGNAGTASVPCGAVLTGVVRDFKGANEPGGHPDFEAFSGVDPSLGIVLPTLGSDRKPVYSADGPFIDVSVNGDDANGQQTTSKANFDQWYRTVPDVNKPYLVQLYSEINGTLRSFHSDSFFPLDGAGWGNTPGLDHNFSFTTEIHARFTYRRGGTFTMTGDDDLWVFVNHHLAIDLGGLHSSASKTLALDTESASLGIEPGEVYDLDLFHAERHSTQSNFSMDTDLDFSECGILLPDAGM
ncbi:MAG: fibro-slime domain-containing protein [Polyangiaceae bacterium]